MIDWVQMSNFFKYKMGKLHEIRIRYGFIYALIIVISCCILIGRRYISVRIHNEPPLENTRLGFKNNPLKQDCKKLESKCKKLLTRHKQLELHYKKLQTQNKQLETQYKQLQMQHKQLEQELQHRLSTPVPKTPSYDELFQGARIMFSYESPFPKWPPPDSYLKKFARLPALFKWNVENQKQLWKRFINETFVQSSHYDLLRDYAGMFPDLDRVSLFCMIREFKPNKMIEIGSGESTHVAQKALQLLNKKYEHIVIEPYRASQVPTEIKVIEKEVQTLELDVYDILNENDILFIDSSHVVMPYGDTLTELVYILPRLNKGVLVHIHDIFLPFDYKPNWMDKNKVYTEQWLLALLLYGNPDWEVIWGSQLMLREHSELLLEMPNYPLNKGQVTPCTSPCSSLWIKKKGDPIR